jgi:hypothetical protein
MSTEQASRKLSTHQQAVLIQVLLTFPDEPIGVCYLPSIADAHAYAEDFLTIFKAINWRVDEAKPAANLAVAAGGLAIVVPEGQLPPSAEALRDALRIYEIEAEIVPDRANLCGAKKFVLAVT